MRLRDLVFKELKQRPVAMLTSLLAILLGVTAQVLRWPLDGGSPNALEEIREHRVDLVVNIPKHYQKEELTNDYIIRRAAVDFGVPLITNLQLAERLVEALELIPMEQLRVRSWRRYKEQWGTEARV